jgi:ligand-binding SRPBCC domain-containing protein
MLSDKKTFVFESELAIKASLEDVFSFFSKAENLEAITPPWLNFKIITPLPIKMEKGTLIYYRLKLYSFPVFWQTEITKWGPPYRFEDTQLRGPGWYFQFPAEFPVCKKKCRHNI